MNTNANTEIVTFLRVFSEPESCTSDQTQLCRDQIPIVFLTVENAHPDINRNRFNLDPSRRIMILVEGDHDVGRSDPPMKFQAYVV